ncbi:MAG: bifunctional homocysteine S-methyltransferase/methylenetetrahydrofolate reductase [Methylacidiphilales bacterium]|nr:bifunctional homocysteine S-methyltransferase/methylenetetrahydrofolate reductase [Candidatus Methylacidiphilales bacterium]
MANLLELLQERVVLGDGATGTYLYELGAPLNHCLEELNLTQPEMVTRVYREYADAGAQVIETNSFGANRIRLAHFGLDDKVGEINRRAAQVAREALRGRDVFIGGSVGPLSLRPADGEYSTDDRKVLFREQIGALLDGGCDLIFLETFAALDELLLALGVFQSLTDIPVAASLAVSEEGRLISGQSLPEAVKILRDAGADIVGINGTCGPQACLHLLSKLSVQEGDLISVFPSAGKPEFYEGRFNYAAGAEYFAAMVPQWVEEGARLVGGDYGTRPEHIAAMASVVRELKPVRVKKSSVTPRRQVEAVGSAVAAPLPEEEVSILDLLKKQQVSVVELDSPKGLSMDKFLAGAKALREAGATAITLADNSLAILRVSNVAAAIRLRQEVGITALLHLACRDRNLIGLQSEIMGMGTLGFRHVLALTGDPARVGDHPGATSVYDVNSLGLIKLLAGMNRGVNAVGRDLQGRTKFIIGCAFNPNALNFESQLRKLESKLAAGAQYVMTQPVFDVGLARNTAARLKPLGVPVFLGVMPLLSSRNAEFLHNEVPGIKIAEPLRERLRHCADDQAATRIGLEVAKEIRDVALESFGGVYLITPFLRYEISVDLLG